MEQPTAAGKSSFDLMEDPEVLFAALPLHGVRKVYDFGCGEGHYALPLARRIPAGAGVRGLDLWEEGIESLRRAAHREGLDNVSAAVADLTELSDEPSASGDLGLFATVLHDLAAEGAATAALDEAGRVLRPGALLAVVEFRKIESDPGPPRRIRLAPDELNDLVTGAGFRHRSLVDLGPRLYLALFENPKP